MTFRHFVSRRTLAPNAKLLALAVPRVPATEQRAAEAAVVEREAEHA